MTEYLKNVQFSSKALIYGYICAFCANGQYMYKYKYKMSSTNIFESSLIFWSFNADLHRVSGPGYVFGCRGGMQSPSSVSLT